MRRAVRIISEYAGHRENRPDPDYKIVIDGVVDEERRLMLYRFFCLAKDGGKSYPFIFESLNSDVRTSQFYWGESCDPNRSAVNIFGRTILANELFTRVEPEFGE